MDTETQKHTNRTEQRDVLGNGGCSLHLVLFAVESLADKIIM